MAKLKVLMVGGVPDKTPPEVMDNQPGGVGLLSNDQTKGLAPPLALKVSEYSTFCVPNPRGQEKVGGLVTVMVHVVLLDKAPKLSVTRILKVYVPATGLSPDNAPVPTVWLSQLGLELVIRRSV